MLTLRMATCGGKVWRSRRPRCPPGNGNPGTNGARSRIPQRCGCEGGTPQTTRVREWSKVAGQPVIHAPSEACIRRRDTPAGATRVGVATGRWRAACRGVVRGPRSRDRMTRVFTGSCRLHPREWGGAEWPMTSAALRAQALGWCPGARIRHDVTETGHEPECVMLDVQLIRKGRWTRSPARATGAVPARELVEEQSR